jgi:regulator of protease activity HflC (stomatin/prohibitin superfamily)
VDFLGLLVLVWLAYGIFQSGSFKSFFGDKTKDNKNAQKKDDKKVIINITTDEKEAKRMADIIDVKGKNNNNKGFGKILIAVAVVIVIGIMLTGFRTIKTGYVGVKTIFGEVTEIVSEPGLHWIFPIGMNIEKVSTQEQLYEFLGDAYTKDTQAVNNLTLKLNYRYEPNTLESLIKDIGLENVVPRIIQPVVSKYSKNEFGKVRAEELVQNRIATQDAIKSALVEALAPQGIVVTNFAIDNMNFNETFESSIEQKVIAEQEALRIQNVTVQREEEAKQAIIKAEADKEVAVLNAEANAESIRIVQEQIAKSPDYLNYLRLDRWDGALPKVMDENTNPFVAVDIGENNNSSSDNSSTTGTTTP